MSLSYTVKKYVGVDAMKIAINKINNENLRVAAIIHDEDVLTVYYMNFDN